MSTYERKWECCVSYMFIHYNWFNVLSCCNDDFILSDCLCAMSCFDNSRGAVCLLGEGSMTHTKQVHLKAFRSCLCSRPDIIPDNVSVSKCLSFDNRSRDHVHYLISVFSQSQKLTLSSEIKKTKKTTISMPTLANKAYVWETFIVSVKRCLRDPKIGNLIFRQNNN